MIDMNGKNSVLAVVLTVVVIGCTNESVDGSLLVEVDRSLCAREAEQLTDQVYSFENPNEVTHSSVVLEAGRFIYRCGKRDEWNSVIYPREGEKIDCSYRSDEQQCPFGWIKGDIVTRSFD